MRAPAPLKPTRLVLFNSAFHHRNLSLNFGTRSFHVIEVPSMTGFLGLSDVEFKPGLFMPVMGRQDSG
ncbi:hypothetical protein B9479_007129 [Cryptococcus floricola]|uniref:Uncharacterized protein n=1 Tax=Cryptococcus floricola TaxID=2591691 RepID=A0A5D3AL75_9TREE|nr:hypothetical protein B9479_007129 [Cryptococcus floricola]